MKDKDIIENLNKLNLYAEIYDARDGVGDSYGYIVNFCKNFTETNKGYRYCIKEDHKKLYRDTLLSIFRKGQIECNYTLNTIKQKTNDFLLEYKIKDSDISERDFNRFFNKINNAKKNKLDIFHKIYGMDIFADDPVIIGCFTLYNYNLHKEAIYKIPGYKSEGAFLEGCEEFANHNFWISTEVEVIDSKKAYEIACERFDIFQGLCQLFIDLQGYNVYAISIMNDVASTRDECYLFSKGEYHCFGENSIRRRRNLNVQVVVSKRHQFVKRIAERVFAEENNQINNRIIRAMAIYGRAVHEYSKEQKLVLYIECIEALIGYDEKNLADMLSDYFSGIVSENYEEFKTYKRSFKTIYDVRSRISHGEKTNVPDAFLTIVREYAICMMENFLDDKEIAGFTKDKDLREHLKSKVVRLEKTTESC